MSQSTFKVLTNKKSKNLQNILAFSLIELSIVLIIIGLLVAGITGGASLIKSTKYKAITAEMFEWAQDALVFKATKNRLPGDLNNDGLIDQATNFPQNVKFKYPYDGTDDTYQKPNHLTAPFVELFLEGISDFKPEKTSMSTSLMTLAMNNAVPSAKYIDGGLYFFKYNEDINTATSMKKNWLYYAKMGNAISLHDGGYFTMDPNIHKNIDTKYDDGIYNSGRIRGACKKKNNNMGNVDYDTTIKNKQKCGELMYVFDNI